MITLTQGKLPCWRCAHKVFTVLKVRLCYSKFAFGDIHFKDMWSKWSFFRVFIPRAKQNLGGSHDFRTSRPHIITVTVHNHYTTCHAQQKVALFYNAWAQSEESHIHSYSFHEADDGWDSWYIHCTEFFRFQHQLTKNDPCSIWDFLWAWACDSTLVPAIRPMTLFIVMISSVPLKQVLTNRKIGPIENCPDIPKYNLWHNNRHM